MSILSDEIENYNDLGKEGGVPKENVKKALEAYNKMKPALTEKMKEKSKPKVFKVDIKEEPKKEVNTSSTNMFGTSTVVDNFEDIGITSKTIKRSKEDKEIDFANKSVSPSAVQLKFVDNSNLYKVEASNVLNLNPFQVSFSANELNQFTYQNPMLDGYKKESL